MSRIGRCVCVSQHSLRSPGRWACHSPGGRAGRAAFSLPTRLALRRRVVFPRGCSGGSGLAHRLRRGRWSGMRPGRFRNASSRPQGCSEREPHPAILYLAILGLAGLFLRVQACTVSGGVRGVLSPVGTFGLGGEGVFISSVCTARVHASASASGAGRICSSSGRGSPGTMREGLRGCLRGPAGNPGPWQSAPCGRRRCGRA
jgi:hypothetical protein